MSVHIFNSVLEFQRAQHATGELVKSGLGVLGICILTKVYTILGTVTLATPPPTAFASGPGGWGPLDVLHSCAITEF